MIKVSIVLLGICATTEALASGNTCFYNGAKNDDRYGTPKSFTGEYSCKDMDTGKITLREQHVNGVREGPYSHYDYQTGALDESGTYLHDKRQGVMKRYQNGNLFLELAYVNGETRGVQKEYQDKVLRRVYLVDEKGRVDAEVTFTPKGQLAYFKCGTRAINKDLEEWCGFNGKQSTVSFYSDEGKVRSTQQYLWGKEHGTSKKFNVVTGFVYQEESFRNGKRDGPQKSFDGKTGVLLHEVQYADGHKQEGGARQYGKQGDLLVKTDCDEQHKACTETRYFDGGKETKSAIDWNGGKIQKQTDYYQNGKPREVVVASGDRFHIVRYFDTGGVESQGDYVKPSRWYSRDYSPDGLIELFSEDGKPSARENYKDGVLQGHVERYWTAQGHALKEEAEYDHDQMLKQKVFIDGTLVDDFEYFPDGSLKSHVDHRPLPGATKAKSTEL